MLIPRGTDTAKCVVLHSKRCTIHAVIISYSLVKKNDAVKPLGLYKTNREGAVT